MERINVLYGYCSECSHPMAFAIQTSQSFEFHDEECSLSGIPVRCRDIYEEEYIAELLYLFIQPDLN
jgi:hypothetical protein